MQRAVVLALCVLVGLTALAAAQPFYAADAEFVPDPTHNMDGNGVHKPKEKAWVTPRYDDRRFRKPHWVMGSDGKAHHLSTQPESDNTDGRTRVIVVPKGDPRAQHPAGHIDVHGRHLHVHHGHHHVRALPRALRRFIRRLQQQRQRRARSSWPDVPARRGGRGYGFSPVHPHKRRGSGRAARRWVARADEEDDDDDDDDDDSDEAVLSRSRPRGSRTPKFKPFVPFPHSRVDRPSSSSPSSPSSSPSSRPLLQAATFSSAACTGKGGACIDANTCGTGTLVRGICPGPAGISCCVPKAASTPATTTTPTTPPVTTPPPASGARPCMNLEGINLVKGFEGFFANFYRDAVGVKTIGYGHACQPDSACNHIKAPLTEPQAASMLAHELTVKYGPTLFGKITRPLNNNQYSALTSFVYNLGVNIIKGQLLVDLNAGNWQAVAARMKLYDKAGGKTLRGLTRRRQAEAALFLKPVTGNDAQCFQ